MEIWNPLRIVDLYYEISSYGRIRSKNKILSQRYHRGYKIISLGSERKAFQVHVLVAKTYIPNPENKPQVNHINGIKDDNRVENLEWCTPSENRLHAYKTGLIPSRKGNNNPNSKFKKQLKQAS